MREHKNTGNKINKTVYTASVQSDVTKLEYFRYKRAMQQIQNPCIMQCNKMQATQDDKTRVFL